MNKVSTAVIVGIVCVAMLGVIIYLNRDGFKKKDSKQPAEGDAEE